MTTNLSKLSAVSAIAAGLLLAPLAQADDFGNGTGTASSVPLPATISGRIDVRGDNDFFRFYVGSPGTLVASSSGATDLYGHLLNASGSTLVSDNNGGAGSNFKISTHVDPGWYFLRVRHASTGTGNYALSIKLTPDAAVDDAGNSCTTAHNLGSIGTGETKSFDGKIEKAADIDFYRVTVSTTTLKFLNVSTTGSTDTVGMLFDANCKLVAMRDDFAGKNFVIAQPVTNGTYYVAVRHGKSTGTGAYSLRVETPTTVWSDQTGYQGPATTVQTRIVDEATAGASGRASLPSKTGSPWLTDMSDGDGARYRAALNEMNTHWVSIKRPTLPFATLPATVIANMKTALTKGVTDLKVAGVSGADADQLIERMRTSFAGSVPTTDDGTLALLGFRAQCREFLDRTVVSAGGTPKAYAAATSEAATDARPGMGAYFYNAKTGKYDLHAAVIVAMKWKADGTPVEVRLTEANWGSGWSAGANDGQVPWLRTITETRVIPFSPRVFRVVKFG